MVLSVLNLVPKGSMGQEYGRGGNVEYQTKLVCLFVVVVFNF